MAPFKLLENMMVKMRDGVHLATDIYLPTHLNQSAFPVVIERTPYNKSAHSRSEIELDGRKISRQEMAEAFTQRGFALIFQDCRGRYLSEGEFIKYVREGEDGFDTYQWIMQQPWCNGSIGSMGLSYAAHTQLAVACLNPEGLKTMVLDSGGFANSYQCGIRQGGAFELKQATWAFKQAALSPIAKNNPLIANAMTQEDIHQWFTQMPWKAGHSPIRHVPEYEDYLLEQWQAGTFNEYWQQLGIYAEGWYKTLPDIPVLFMSSWYDAYVPSTLANFQAFCALGRTAPQKLIMGSWLHGDRNITHSGDVEFGLASTFDGNVDTNWLECRLKWFEQHLKPNSPRSPQHQISFFMMGGGSGKKDEQGKMQHGGEWIYSTAYPFPESTSQKWYLQKDMRLRQSLSEPAIHRFQSDPNNPVPTIGGAITSGKPVFVGGAFDQRELPDFFGSKQNNLPLSARHDVLVYQTDILEEDITLVGEVKVKLFIDSDAPDADFTAKLIDVYPPNEDYPQGYAMNITDGILRARYRESWTEPKLLKQGEIVEVTIRPFESCNIFKKGHRLRLDIAGSNFPHFDCNPNSGEPEGFASVKRIATNQIHIGAQYPSVLEIQVIPNK
ncbi:CocE/NonD family hydrolase [Glaesserella parasuis]|nr:CocE/NonD family hydrolase [Glaesserella parasuis]MCT8674780.1 CocE/NonD family hydrolase [Glaesserella parasuis]MCT8683415.1 CocE/NonD family hydrolase [Glaesserella parasuis]MCT8773542.1 CocE/NonD family hydrolase [Glaesserella parasuis]MCT8807501.1 CocE/NonD family hydrolase [Glaesserella parasuis]